jgi:hypothetical protein
MSLWTPSGEHPVDREPQSQPQPEPERQPQPDPESLEDLTPEQRAQVEEMARQMQEAQAQMLRLPAGTVVGRQAAAFYDLAVLYLSQDQPRLDDARLAVDALAAVTDKLGPRLQEAEQPLRQMLTQVQMAFVEMAGSGSSGPSEEPGESQG